MSAISPRGTSPGCHRKRDQAVRTNLSRNAGGMGRPVSSRASRCALAASLKAENSLGPGRGRERGNRRAGPTWQATELRHRVHRDLGRGHRGMHLPLWPPSASMPSVTRSSPESRTISPAVTVAATRPDRRKQSGPRGSQSFYRQNHGRAVTLSCRRSGRGQRQTI